MAYYVLENHQGYVSDPGFMQNFIALGKALGKSGQQGAMKDAVAKNNLIPEYDQDAEGNVKTSYKSPQLVGRGITFPNGPGGPAELPVNPNKNSASNPDSLSKTIKDMIAQEASKGAMQQAGDQQIVGSPAGVPGGTTQNQDGSLTGPNGEDIGEVSRGTQFQPVANPQQVYLDAIKQQAKTDPMVAKSLGLPTQKFTPKGKAPAGAVKFSPSTGKYYDKDGNEI